MSDNNDDLLALAREGDWDALASRIRQEKNGPSVSRWDLPDGTLLHLVCHNSSVTVDVIAAILEVGGPELLSKRNWLGQTPLHVACSLGGAQPDIVEHLVRAAATANKLDTVRAMDNERVRPIDHVCQKIIMKEERARYDTTCDMDEEVLKDLWKSSRIIVQALRKPAAGSRHFLEQQPMVHSCLQIGNDCPFALWERALQRFPDDIRAPDEDGNIPLHIAAAMPPTDEDETDYLFELISLYPGGAMIRNKARELPLDLAIASGRKWKTGTCALLNAYPAALESRDIDTRYYPLILSHIGKVPSLKSMLLQILLAKPDLFAQANVGTNQF